MPKDKDGKWEAIPTPTTKLVVGLFRSRNVIWNNDHKIVASFGLTWTQFLTLRALRFAEPDRLLSPTALYEATQASSGGITKMLHALGAAGYVTRISNPDDKRSKLVHLTQAGSDLVEDIIDALMHENTEKMAQALTQAEQEQLATLLSKLTTQLESQSG